MTIISIPYLSDNKDISIQDSNYKKNIEKHRNTILGELRCLSGIPEIARNLNKNTVYKLVYTPSGGKLLEDSAGNIKGVFYKDGKILEHAKFSKISPSLVKAVTTIGSQILLVSIAMQLNRIEKGITRLSEELHGDRVAEIKSGVTQFRQAVNVTDQNRQSRMIENAIQTLNTGIEKTLRSLKIQIEGAPSEKIGFWDNWLTNKSSIASEKMKTSEESFQACLIGIKTLSECFAIIGEPKVASEALISNLSKLDSCGIDVAINKSRLIPKLNSYVPEEPWLKYLDKKDIIIETINQLLPSKNINSIEIELKPKELMGN